MDPYQLSQSVFTEQDFDQMGWHDCYIHAFTTATATGDTFKSELILDIDYILKWVTVPGDGRFFFWVVPCTLVFSDVLDLSIHIESGQMLPEFCITGISREEKLYGNGYSSRRWNIELLGGEIKFEATGYHQFIRRLPVYTPEQYFSVEERGGISFDRTPVSLKS